MARKSSIRWREADNKELRRVVKNFNAKITRQRQKLIEQGRRYEASMLPTKASVKDLRATIETRREFNSQLAEMENFIRTGKKFKLDGNTEKSLTATVRDFNRKVDRLSAKAKTQGERASLPEKISPEELIKNASSKESLIRDIKTYKGFLKKGAETLEELPETKFNIKLTRWQKETMGERIEEINRARKEEIEQWKETQVKYGGRTAEYTQGQARMYEEDFDLPPLKMYTYSSTYGDVRRRFKLSMRESQEGYWEARTELARINYTEKLKEVVGNHPIGKSLVSKIERLPLEDFKKALKGDDDLFLKLYDFDYDPEQFEALLSDLWGEWFPDEDFNNVLEDYMSKFGG